MQVSVVIWAHRFRRDDSDPLSSGLPEQPTMRGGAASRGGGMRSGYHRGANGQGLGAHGGEDQFGSSRSSNTIDERGATLSSLQDAAFSELMFLVIGDVTEVLLLSLVCRRWSEAVRQVDIWEEKDIFIAGLNLSCWALRAWYPRWRRGTVVMTYADRDQLVDPNQQRHVVCHPWAIRPAQPVLPQRPWATVVIDGLPWALCLTRFRGPLDAEVYQDMSARNFTRPFLIGWTSAVSHDEFGRIASRVRAGSARASDTLAGTTLWPLGALEDEYAVDFEDLRRPPLCFDEGHPWMARLRLNREGRSLTVHTPRNEETTEPLAGAHVNLDGALRLFVAVPEIARGEVANLPELRLRPTFFEPA